MSDPDTRELARDLYKLAKQYTWVSTPQGVASRDQIQAAVADMMRVHGFDLNDSKQRDAAFSTLVVVAYAVQSFASGTDIEGNPVDPRTAIMAGFGFAAGALLGAEGTLFAS